MCYIDVIRKLSYDFLKLCFLEENVIGVWEESELLGLVFDFLFGYILGEEFYY